MTTKTPYLKTIFHWSDVKGKWINEGKLRISGVEYKTDYGHLLGYFIKTKGLPIENNLCGFCLN